MGRATQFLDYLNSDTPNEYFTHLTITDNLRAIKKNYKKTMKSNVPKEGIAVDCSVTGGNPGNAEYRGIDLSTGEVVFEFTIEGKCSNNIAEFGALVHGVNYLIKNNIKGKVYSDSQTALAWYKHGKHKSTLSLYGDTKMAHAILENAINKIPTANKMQYVAFWNKRLIGYEIPADYRRK